MADMYNVIMDLPLFKGISREQVSAFLEKTSIDFVTYDNDNLIIAAGDTCEHILFVVSGNIKEEWIDSDENVMVSFHRGYGAVIGGKTLFGLHKGNITTVKADGKVSLLKISKPHYMALLQSSTVYLLNYLNYLSLSAQRPTQAITEYGITNPISNLKMLISIITPSDAQSIKIKYIGKGVAKARNGLTKRAFNQMCMQLVNDNLMSVAGANWLINDRRSFLA